MGKLIAAINITQDGFCEHTNVIADEEHHQFSNNLLKDSETVLFGRVTYELFESYWPNIAKIKSGVKSVDEFAQLIDKVHKIAFSRTVSGIQWSNTTLIRDITQDQIIKLKQGSDKNILVLGSPTIIAKLTELKLIDEYYFSIQPIIAGNGVRLFDTVHLNKTRKLKLLDITTFKSGVTTLCYRTKN